MEPQQEHGQQQQTRRQLLRAGVFAALAFLIIVIFIAIFVYFFGWKWTGLPTRTLWDWLDLLFVPAVLAGGGLWFSRQQRERELRISNRHTQDATLHAYLDKMWDMIPTLQSPHEPDETRPGDSLSSVSAARARTLTVLKILDSDGKARVVQFLYESGLIGNPHPVIDLNGADLNGANLRRIEIGGMEIVDRNGNGIEVTGIDIRVIHSDHKKGVFRGACLRNTHLRNACLLWANLQGTDLSGTHLLGADLRGAYLQGANLTHAQLNKADLRGARLEGAKLFANITGANLKGAKGKLGETLPNETLADAVREGEVLTGQGESISPKGGAI